MPYGYAFPARESQTSIMDRAAGSFLAALTTTERDELLSRGKPRLYHEGQPILVQGEVGDHVVLLRNGRAKVSIATREGRDVLLGLRGSGDVLGELGYLFSSPRTATVVAVDPVTAVAVEFAALRGFLHHNPRVLHEIARTVSDRLTWADRRHAEACLPVIDRLVRVLHELAVSAGAVSPNSWHQPHAQEGIEIPLTQRELGQLIGAAEVSVQRALRQLAEEGWLTQRYGRVTVLRPAALGRRPSSG